MLNLFDPCFFVCSYQVAPRNTIGDVPLEWYKDEEHIGYDIAGKKLKKKERQDKLDAFLASADDSKNWLVLFDTIILPRHQTWIIYPKSVILSVIVTLQDDSMALRRFFMLKGVKFMMNTMMRKSSWQKKRPSLSVGCWKEKLQMLILILMRSVNIIMLKPSSEWIYFVILKPSQLYVVVNIILCYVQPYVDWFKWDDAIHPLSNAPEPKRRFTPSKWEAKKVGLLGTCSLNGIVFSWCWLPMLGSYLYLWLL